MQVRSGVSGWVSEWEPGWASTWWIVAGFCSAALASVAIAQAAWARRSAGLPARLLVLCALAAMSWCVSVVLMQVSPDQDGREAARALYFASVHAANLTFFLICCSLSDPSWRPRRRPVLRLAATPLLLLLGLVSNRWHHLFYAHDSVGRTPLDPDPGPLVWASTIWTFYLLVAALITLARGGHRVGGYFWRQAASVALSAGVPAALGVISVVYRPQLSGTDLTPLGFLVTAAVTYRAIVRLGWMRVVPIAHRQVLANLRDAIIVVDLAGVVVETNPPARALLRRLQPLTPLDDVGRPAAEVLWPELLALLDGGDQSSGKHPQPATASSPTSTTSGALSPTWGLHVDVQVSSLVDEAGRLRGRVVVLRDVSDLVIQRQALLELNVQLREQLDVNEGLRTQLVEEAARDPLTGLHNRRRLQPVLTRGLEDAQQAGGELSVVILDVDRFKTINDTHGHPAGDAVLVAIAGVLRRHRPSGGLVARMGGEEFIVVMPGIDAAQAAARSEDLRQACKDLVVETPSGSVRLTVSIGTATFPQDGTSGDDLLTAADAALYVAKRSGRDRVIAAGATDKRRLMTAGD